MQGQMLDIIDKIYASLVDDEAEGELLREITRKMGMGLGVQQVISHDSGESRFVHCYAPEYEGNEAGLNHLIQDYNCRLSAINPLPRISFAKNLVRQGAIMRTEDFMTRKDWRRSEYFNEYFRANDWEDHAAMIVELGSSSLISFSFAYYRNQANSVRDTRAQNLLVQHLCRAFQIRRRLNHESLRREASWTALDAISSGVAILDDRGKILFLNRQAEAILSAPGPIGVRRERLYCKSVSQDRQLTEAIGRASKAGTSAEAADPGTTLVMETAEPPRKIGVTTYPLRMPRSGDHTGRPACLVFVSDTARSIEFPGDRLRAAFGLTPTESRVAVAIASGESLEQCAADLGHSVTTSRTILKRVYSKTGVSRQNQLARLMLALQDGAVERGDG